MELQGQDNALLAPNLRSRLYFPAGSRTIIAEQRTLGNNSAEGPGWYFSIAAERLVGEKESDKNIYHNSLQNSNDSQEQAAMFGHTTDTIDQMWVVNIHGAISV